MALDWGILHWIQNNISCPFLDAVVPKLTMLGNAGIIWILAGVLLLCTKKYRRQGVTFWPVRCWASPSERRYTVRRDRAYARDLPAAADTKTVKRRKSSFFFLSGLINGNCCGILGINWWKRGAFHVLTGVTVPLTVATPERIDLAQAARYFGAGHGAAGALRTAAAGWGTDSGCMAV